MNCSIQFDPTDWFSWSSLRPIDPLRLINFASLQMSPNIPDTGQVINSSTFNTPTATPIPTPEIIGVSISSSSQAYTPLANMPVDIISLTVGSSDSPDTIDVTFSSPPDIASVTTSSFSVQQGIHPITGNISFPSPNIARFQAVSTFAIGSISVALYGTNIAGSGVITFFGSIPLDGEPLQLPSGDGIPGGIFSFNINVLSGSTSPTNPPASIGGWNPSLFSLSSSPFCTALGTDNLQAVANANQWNFSHGTANLYPSIPSSLSNTIYLRAGAQWQMTIPFNLGSLLYPDIQIGFLLDAATRGDMSGTIPVISFTSRKYSGLCSVQLNMRITGTYIIGIRAIDVRGNYFMYESNVIIE